MHLQAAGGGYGGKVLDPGALRRPLRHLHVGRHPGRRQKGATDRAMCRWPLNCPQQISPTISLQTGHACLDVPSRLCTQKARALTRLAVADGVTDGVADGGERPPPASAELAVAPPHCRCAGGGSFQDSHSASGDAAPAGVQPASRSVKCWNIGASCNCPVRPHSHLP